MDLQIVAVLCLVSLAEAKWTKGMENPGLYQGDMVLTPEQRERVRAGTFQFASTIGLQWPSGKIPFTIDNSLGKNPQAAKVIMEAIADYHKYTCIRFHKRSTEKAYVHFFMGDKCSSPVGYSGGVNAISLGSLCWYKGTAMHEIGHSLGLYHEQSRPDRDNFVTIIWNNIESGMNSNFDMQPRSKVDSLGTPYDYKSMMHYDSTAFGKGKITIRTKDPTMQNVIGQRNGFSDIDIQQIGLLYKKQCGGSQTTTPSSICEDTSQHCSYWAQQGECQKNPAWMLESCKKSCKKCSPPAGCVDTNQDCAAWAQQGECQKNPDWMLEGCKKSCKKCTPPAGCVDSDVNCSIWAQQGECQKNPAWMLEGCKKSCKQC